MDLVPYAWNFRKRLDPPPIFSRFSRSQIAKIVCRMRHMQQQLNTLGIFADDTQYFIDIEGLILLVDLDAYYFSSRENHFEADIFDLLQKYHANTKD